MPAKKTKKKSVDRMPPTASSAKDERRFPLANKHGDTSLGKGSEYYVQLAGTLLRNWQRKN